MVQWTPHQLLRLRAVRCPYAHKLLRLRAVRCACSGLSGLWFALSCPAVQKVTSKIDKGGCGYKLYKSFPKALQYHDTSPPGVGAVGGGRWSSGLCEYELIWLPSILPRPSHPQGHEVHCRQVGLV